MSEYIEVEPIQETWTVQEIATRRPPRGWREVFEKCRDEFRDLSEDISYREQREGKFFPLRRHLFRAFELTPLEDVKVVIVGQDPYPQYRDDGYPRAQGLSFSVGRRDQIPSSLQNIFKEIEQSIDGWEHPGHGDLTYWASQGVLLLNMSLTVSPGKPNSYGEIWMQFIVKVLDAINRTNPHCIYVMWGKEAQKLVRYISDKALILTAPHPSGLSAHRGFLGCNHFSIINETLKKRGLTPIDWSL